MATSTVDIKGERNKGRIFAVYTKYIHKKWGQEGVDACQKATGIPSMDFKSETWYPHEYGVDMASWIGDNHGLDACKGLGFHISTERGVVSHFAWIAGMNRVLDRLVAEMRDSVNYGELVVERGEDRKSATIYFNGICGSPAGCQLWLGVFEGLMHLTKTKGTTKKIACEHDGGDHCVYEMKW